ncbi:nucleoside-triphosphate diphosphatase [Bordetella sp. H567]|uniref:RdgB/HAM1 family non-canonical purine NTP pyrophosphatase n=1 Tax=Bordetella sp. H567 TaxID=1697043 RepID=UPI00081D13E8|nr:RdgB/HAM1 family non-canonical purine NTP pyrophosphatase [Bordetella sp. H567]AOB31544.1 nucleoside-triphosphate diphosphatase [Bordetella sp. H567]
MRPDPVPGLARVVLASGNAGKLREFSALFAPLGIELIPQGQLGVPEADEPHCTFIENALEKARHASRLTGLPALADDSGLCVDALGGAPGVYSARYASLKGGEKSDAANNAMLVRELAGQPDRRACYVAVLALVRAADDPRPLVGEGAWYGEIVDIPRGDHGFGYDPHFHLPALGKTAAELAPADKNAVSHRAQALRELLAKLDRAAR